MGFIKKFVHTFFIFLLYGCRVNAVIPTPTVSPLVFTPQATRLTPTEVSVADNTSTGLDEACPSAGKIDRYQIDSLLLDGPLYFSVYFPPCYDPEKSPAYPVLYALHGQNFNDAMWSDLGLETTANRLFANGDVMPFLVVMPYEEYYFRSADGNNFPIALQEEIIPWVEQSLNVCSEKVCRAIGGISRGASWAMRIGLTEWNSFGAIGAHSLPTFRGDTNKLPNWLEDIPFGEEPRIYMDTGRFDPEVKNAYRFEQILSQKGIPHEWHLNAGRHNEVYWKEHLESYIRWYGEKW